MDALGCTAPPPLVLHTRDMAELGGVTPRTLRHYHKMGLLPDPPRNSQGYRIYTARDLVRLLRIRQLAAGGMQLSRIGEALSQDQRGQGQLLADLDRKLRAQASLLAAQRKLVAQLRRAVSHPHVGLAHDRSATGQLDHDTWVLLSALAPAAAAAAATELLDKFDPDELQRLIEDWYPSFVGLEQADHVDSQEADQLARRIAQFAQQLDTAAAHPTGEADATLTSLVQQMQNEVMSAAQQDVWARFMTLVAGDEGASSNLGQALCRDKPLAHSARFGGKHETKNHQHRNEE